MCAFKPGDEVVCILDKNMPWDVNDDLDVTGIVVGETYTVATVGPDPYGDGPFVFLVETGNIDCDGVDWGYYAIRFRKVQKPKTTLSIETFLTIKPGFEEPRRVNTPAKERV